MKKYKTITGHGQYEECEEKGCRGKSCAKGKAHKGSVKAPVSNQSPKSEPDLYAEMYSSTPAPTPEPEVSIMSSLDALLADQPLKDLIDKAKTPKEKQYITDNMYSLQQVALIPVEAEIPLEDRKFLGDYLVFQDQQKSVKITKYESEIYKGKLLGGIFLSNDEGIYHIKDLELKKICEIKQDTEEGYRQEQTNKAFWVFAMKSFSKELKVKLYKQLLKKALNGKDFSELDPTEHEDLIQKHCKPEHVGIYLSQSFDKEYNKDGLTKKSQEDLTKKFPELTSAKIAENIYDYNKLLSQSKKTNFIMDEMFEDTDRPILSELGEKSPWRYW